MIEKSLEYFKNRLSKTLSDKRREAYQDAVRALEKQQPKKLIERHYEEEGEEPYIKMTCPNGCRLQPSRTSNYCRECGQRLDWSE